MDEIFKLIDINKRRGQRSIQLVNQNFRKKEVSKDNILYDAIINGKYKSDEEAAKDMFGADPGNRNYRNTKGKLKQKLLNHMYFLDYEKNDFSNYDKVEYEILHLLHQCYILSKEGVADIAMRRLPLIAKTAKEYEIVNVAVKALEIMRWHYAEEGKTTPFKETNDEIKKLKNWQLSIEECQERFEMALVNINKSESSQNKILDNIPSEIEFLQQCAKKYNSHRLAIMAYKLQIIYHALQYEFGPLIEICNTLEKKYLNKPINRITVPINKLEITFRKLHSFFFLGKYQEGISYSEKNLKMFKSGTEEWFEFIEFYFLSCMHDKKFQKAAALYRLVRTNKSYNQLEETISDRWQVYRSYLIFLHETKLLKWGFDLEEFLAAKPDHPKELQGYNISILVSQFLFLLREGRVHEVRDKINLLEQYSSVHLDKRHNYRNSIFIRMLSIILDKEFNYELINEKAETYLKKLHRYQIPFDLKNDIEVLPFQLLWEYIIHILKTNKYYIHYRFYNPAENYQWQENRN